MSKASLIAAMLRAEMHWMMLRDGEVTLLRRPDGEVTIIGASPSSIIVDELPQPWAPPRPASSLYGNPRPYLKRKKGRS